MYFSYLILRLGYFLVSLSLVAQLMGFFVEEDPHSPHSFYQITLSISCVYKFPFVTLQVFVFSPYSYSLITMFV
jgi:hypothetical protein